MRCIVPGCDIDSSRTSIAKGLTFHTFPKEPKLYETWLNSLEIQGLELTEDNVVCSTHFQKDDLNVSRNGHCSVRTGAIPVNIPKSDTWMTPCDVKVCRICFATDCKLYLMTKHNNLDQAYKILTGLLEENNDKLPPYLCAECSHRLLDCIQFRTRSVQANLILQEIIQKNDCLTLEAIRSCYEYSLLSSKLAIVHNQTDHYDLEIEHVERENIYKEEQGYIGDSSGLYAVSVIKVEKNEALIQDSLEALDTTYGSISPPRLHEVNLPGIKLEMDDMYRQDDPNYEDATKGNSSTLHNTIGINVKVETIETSEQDCFEGEADHIIHNGLTVGEDYSSDHGQSLGEQELRGEDYPSDNVLLEELQKVKHNNQSYLKAHAGTNSHIKTQSGKKLYSCDVCNRVFSQKYNLIPHLRIHSGVKPYSCDLCKKEFRLKYNLIHHLRTHSGEKPYSCNICKKSFILRNVLQAHLRTHTGEKPYACKLCDKAFSQRANLSAHIKTHSGEKPYSCDICNKGFSQRCNLITHSRVHSGEKPYSCNVCMISFSRNYHLKSHLKVHSGEKPYTCDVCKKAFNSQSNLQKHMTIHSGVKPYSCNVCNKAFNRKGNLNTHIKTHSDEKPYQCVVCNKAFRRKDQLKIHIRVHSSEKPFSVNIKDLYDRII